MAFETFDHRLHRLHHLLLFESVLQADVGQLRGSELFHFLYFDGRAFLHHFQPLHVA